MKNIMPSEEKKSTSSSTNLIKFIAIPVLVFFGAILTVFAITSLNKKTSPKIVQEAVQNKNDEYQAVFLANGSVYFGKIKSENSQNVVLADVYYLKKSVDLKDETQTKLNLIKRGKELHGPEDEMRINRQQVLFIENVKPDSSVALAIGKAKEQEVMGAATQVSPTATPGEVTPTVTGDRFVTIKSSETGYVRVRREPSLVASESAQVKNGNRYKILSEQNGWFQIEYEAGQTGWVSSQYAAAE